MFVRYVQHKRGKNFPLCVKVEGVNGLVSELAVVAAHMAAAPPHMNQVPPLSSTVQKPPYVGDEQQTVDGLLQHLGLGKYAIIFKAEEIDMTALKQMGENDLKELGIPMVEGVNGLVSELAVVAA
ncbi:uncharacterized protein LOC133714465 isoform X2 [Rosa rugosa]|uniref:uncharacterized protein LOC133714465 isoform X2 n=1 Tax=Rosa rugosa TaxID=74645 RepID=UPI002B40D88F|nr:uncharacterized protein LOC133714465 isoform X2 [Rosa rugosa]